MLLLHIEYVSLRGAERRGNPLRVFGNSQGIAKAVCALPRNDV